LLAQVTGQAAVAHQDGDLVQGFGRQGPEIPGSAHVAQVAARVAFLCVDEVGELQWIPYKEDRSVIAHEVPVSVFCIEFEGKSSNVAFCIGGSCFTSYGGKT